LSNNTLLSNKSGSIKGRTRTIDNYVLWGCAGSAHAQIRQLIALTTKFTTTRRKIAQTDRNAIKSTLSQADLIIK